MATNFTDDELDDIAPFLKNIRQTTPESGFRTPPDYFEGLEDRLWERIQTEEHQTPVRAMRLRWISYSAAACVVGILGIFVWQIAQRPAIATSPQLATTLSYQELLATVSAADIHAYLLDHADEVDTEWLAGQTNVLPAQPLELEEALLNEDDLEDDILF